jgi:hypothetical protein
MVYGLLKDSKFKCGATREIRGKRFAMYSSKMFGKKRAQP